MSTYNKFLKEQEDIERQDELKQKLAEEELHKVELHKQEKQQTYHTLDTIKRRWHKLPQPESKFHKKATRMTKSEFKVAKAGFIKERKRLKRAEKLQCKARLKELRNKIKQVDLQLEGSMYKQKRRFAYQRRMIIKSAELKDWYAKQVALEEVCKIKDKHLEQLKRLNEEHKKTVRMIKEEAIEHLSKIISQKKKSIGMKKRDFLERKGWAINETIRQYEEVLEFEEEQVKKNHSRDSDEMISHLMHSGDSNKQYILDHEKFAGGDEEGYFPSELHRSGILQ